MVGRTATRGTWCTVSIGSGGTTTGQDKTDTITYDGTRYVQRHGDAVWSEGVIEIVDATAKPKRINYAVTDGLNKGLKAESIYLIDGDDHQINSGSPGSRPTEFTGAAGFYRVMRRATAEDLRPPEVRYESAAFTTDLNLPGAAGPAGRVTVICRPADGEAGTLTLHPPAKFNPFGDPALAEPPATPVTVAFTLKLVRAEKTRTLFDLRGPKVPGELRLVVYSPVTSAEAGRLLVRDRGGEVRQVIGLSKGPVRP